MDGEVAIPDDRVPRVAGTARAMSLHRTVNLDLSRVTLGERLWLWRHSSVSATKSRRGVDVHSVHRDTGRSVASTQMEAALRLKVDKSAYWAAENDVAPADEVLVLLAQVDEPPYELKDALRLARHRSSLTLPRVALGAEVGSCPTFYKLERAGDERVAAFWRRQGFRFPRRFPIYFKGER